MDNDPTETLEKILPLYFPFLSGCKWSLAVVPVWSNPEDGQVGLQVIAYESVHSQQVQLAGFALRVVKDFVQTMVTGPGISGLGIRGGTGLEPVDMAITGYRKAKKVQGLSGAPREGFVRGMQVAGAQQSGDPAAVRHAAKAAGRVLLEAVVRIEPITSGLRYLVHATTDAAHADFVLSHVMDFDGWTDTKTYWVYPNGMIYENGEPVDMAA